MAKDYCSPGNRPLKYTITVFFNTQILKPIVWLKGQSQKCDWVVIEEKEGGSGRKHKGEMLRGQLYNGGVGER